MVAMVSRLHSPGRWWIVQDRFQVYAKKMLLGTLDLRRIGEIAVGVMGLFFSVPNTEINLGVFSVHVNVISWLLYFPILYCIHLLCAGRICFCALHYLQGSLSSEGSCSCWPKMADLEIPFFCDERYFVYISSCSACMLPTWCICFLYFQKISMNMFLTTMVFSRWLLHWHI